MRVKIEPRPRHLHVTVGGVFDYQQLVDALKETFAASSAHGLRKILIDAIDVEGEVSLMARFGLGQTAAALQREPVRLAVVASEDQVWPDRFVENVANNRGVLTKVTTDMAEALEWLHRDAATKPKQGEGT